MSMNATDTSNTDDLDLIGQRRQATPARHIRLTHEDDPTIPVDAWIEYTEEEGVVAEHGIDHWEAEDVERVCINDMRTR